MMVATDRLDRSPISRTKSVALQEINISDSLKLVPQDQAVEQLIDNANEAIERFMLADQQVIENFVTCDFHLTQSALAWILENHLSIGERFCELGSGFGLWQCGRRDCDWSRLELKSNRYCR
ncbi:hypothetical protein N9Z64_01310 [bacterium]|nr:hypothetical protein [bacterium]MDB4540199.1 hypothetical protein [bacterium]